MTLDELAEALRIPSTHRLVAIKPLEYEAGISIIIRGDDLPDRGIFVIPDTVDLAAYRDLLERGDVPRGTPDPPTPIYGSNQPPYIAPIPSQAQHVVKPPVQPSDPDNWPKFPGENLNYRGLTDVDAVEDEHMGGPR